MTITPRPRVTCFSKWWCQAIKGFDKKMRKGLNCLIILVAWEIWKHRNARVFEGVLPNVKSLLHAVANEGILWCTAGASALKEMLLQLSTEI